LSEMLFSGLKSLFAIRNHVVVLALVQLRRVHLIGRRFKILVVLYTAVNCLIRRKNRSTTSKVVDLTIKFRIELCFRFYVLRPRVLGVSSS